MPSTSAIASENRLLKMRLKQMETVIQERDTTLAERKKELSRLERAVALKTVEVNEKTETITRLEARLAWFRAMTGITGGLLIAP